MGWFVGAGMGLVVTVGGVVVCFVVKGSQMARFGFRFLEAILRPLDNWMPVLGFFRFRRYGARAARESFDGLLGVLCFR